jgi:excisionase family DNA binding protein
MDLLTVDEAAELVRAPAGSLRFWRHQGTGPASAKLGKRIVYRRDDLEAWVQAQFDAQAAVEASRR